MRPLLAALLASEAFWAPENRGRLVKSPVDLIVGTLRLFALPVENERDLAWLRRRLGQDLFDPPDVSGWPGGTASITGATLPDPRRLIDRHAGGATQDAFFPPSAAPLPPAWADAQAANRKGGGEGNKVT